MVLYDSTSVPNGYGFLDTNIYMYNETTPVRIGKDLDGKRYAVLYDVVRGLGYMSRSQASATLRQTGLGGTIKMIRFFNGRKVRAAKAYVVDKKQLAEMLRIYCVNDGFANWLLNVAMGGDTSMLAPSADTPNTVEVVHKMGDLSAAVTVERAEGSLATTVKVEPADKQKEAGKSKQSDNSQRLNLLFDMLIQTITELREAMP